MKKRKNYAYIDGSFNPRTNTYGWGGFIMDQNGKKHTIQGYGDIAEIAKHRNVAGEIYGCANVLFKAILLKMTEITVYYDYDGVANWPLKKWKCNNPLTEQYAAFVQAVLSYGLKIHFQKVKSHAGNLENEEADRLAKEAVGIEIGK